MNSFYRFEEVKFGGESQRNSSDERRVCAARCASDLCPFVLQLANERKKRGAYFK